MQADYDRLLTRREQLETQPDGNLDEILKSLRRMNKPETMPRAELRRYAVALISRIAVTSLGHHKGDDIRIEWVDSKVTEFHLQHRAGEKNGWTFAEIEAVKTGVAEGWTQLEFAAACPTRTWHEIQNRIGRKFGRGITIPTTRKGESITFVSDYSDVSEEDLKLLTKRERERVKRIQRRQVIRHYETYADYCKRVLGFVPEFDNRRFIVARKGENLNAVGVTNDGVTITQATGELFSADNPVSSPSNSVRRSPCRG